jgi:uncharacterized protein YbjT (DUF2867 family)
MKTKTYMPKLYTATVVGATGLVGRSLVQQLLVSPSYQEVTCLVRRPLGMTEFYDPDNKLRPLVIDFDLLQDYQGYFSVDHVYCCLGTTMKKAGSRAAFRYVDFQLVHVCAQLARAQRANGFVWVSSIGANAKSKNFYLKVKGELERSILTMPQLEYAAAVRPSLLIGERHEYRRAEQLGLLFAKYFPFVFVGPLKKFKPVTADHVALQMIQLQPK